jgi:hypothetical protein
MLKDAEVSALEATHGKLVRIHGVDPLDEEFEWEVFLRRPTQPEYISFRGTIHDPSQKSYAQERTFRCICVYPDATGIKALLARLPAIPDCEAVGDIIGKMLGLTGAARGK